MKSGNNQIRNFILPMMSLSEIKSGILSEKEISAMEKQQPLSSVPYFMPHVPYLKRKALRFTLIELLIVIAIITILPVQNF